MRQSWRVLVGSLVACLTAIASLATAQTYQSRIEHPIVHYKMSASLYPGTKTVKGHYVLTWWNHTDDAIRDLYFHLYLNAFKNLDSTFMRRDPIAREHDSLTDWLTIPGKEKWGWEQIDRIQIVNGSDLTPLITYVHPDDNNADDRTVVRIQLPQPIPPKGSIELSVDFTSKLPRVFARTGYDGDYYLVSQWFPKIGVYEGPGERGLTTGGWNCHQFHRYTEFYADYGSYDVDLTLPSDYIVGATGFGRSEKKDPDGTATYNFYQQDVHDFAWTASPGFKKVTRTFDWGKEVRGDEVARWSEILSLPASEIALRNVSVTLLLQPYHRNLEGRYFRAVFNGLKYYGLRFGAYPYDTLTVVDPPHNSYTSGMEYPTLFVAGSTFWPGKHEFQPEGVTIHEFGHQFWYGLVGNNEFEEPWLDEGFVTYSTAKVLETAYGSPCSYLRVMGIPIQAYGWLQVPLPKFPFVGVESIPVGPYFSCVKLPEATSGRSLYLQHATDDDLVRNGWEYRSRLSYVVNSYMRPGLNLDTLDHYLGPAVMARVMRSYQQEWRYRHPTTRDFIDVVNSVSGRDMDWFFQQFFYNSNLVDYAVASIWNEPLYGHTGIYDEGGKKAYYSRKDAVEEYQQDRQKQYRSTVTVRRLGGASAPVDIDVRFDNGQVAHEQWDGKYRWTKFSYAGQHKVVSAVVDRSRKLLLDSDYTNNSRTVKADSVFAVKWYIRWIFWIENLFFAAGFFS
ncbi:MAG TPA: M1 family metallopeptidase [Terriglobia bacterium]|nr:M1 family metallopeptidase [Terriglobia bacterium]